MNSTMHNAKAEGDSVRGLSGSRAVTSHYSQGESRSDMPPTVKASAQGSGIKISPFSDILGKKFDADQLLIAALLLILVKEGADMKLILALGYILM